jgi:hypothetical protein
MSKVSLAEQIEALESARREAWPSRVDPLDAAIATLRLFQKYEPEVRDLLSLCIKRDEELPGSRIEVRE